MYARLGLLVLALVIVAPVASRPEGPAGAAMFGGGPDRNLANTAVKGIPAAFSIDPAKGIKWQADVGDSCLGGPLVAEGKVFVGTNNEQPRDPNIKGDKGVVMCFDEATGKFLWQITHDKLAAPIDTPKIGIASTPAVENGKLWYVSNRCEVVCAETATGKVLWTYDMIKQLGVYPGGLSGGLANCSPLLLGDLVYVVTSNATDAQARAVKNPKAPSLIAVEKATGKLVWQDDSPGKDVMDGQWSSPAAVEIDGRWQVIYGGGDGWLRGFEAKTGKLLWKFDCNPKGLTFQSSSKLSKNYIVATPVVHDKKVYVAVGQEPDAGNGMGFLWCIDPAKKPANKDLDLSPVDNDFDPKSPKNKDSGLVWVHGGEVKPKPAGFNDRIFHFQRSLATVAVHDGLVYAVETTGFLQCIDAQTGKKLWEEDLQDVTWSSPYYVDGKVYIGTEAGMLYVFQAGRQLKLLEKIDMTASLKTPPVAANGVLFISNGSKLYAIGK